MTASVTDLNPCRPRLRTASEVLPVITSVRAGEEISRGIVTATPLRTPARKKLTCSRCNAFHNRRGQAYCLDCHNANMRAWRKEHPLTPGQRVKDNARSYANTYRRRGKIEQEPCIVCNDPNSEIHHPDYNRPLWVQWLCRPCHLSLHRLVVQEYDAEKLKPAIAETRELIASLKGGAA